MIREPTQILDHLKFLIKLDLCFTTTTSRYKYNIFPPICNSNRNLAALNYNWESWGTLRRFNASNLCNNSWFDSEHTSDYWKCGVRVMEQASHHWLIWAGSFFLPKIRGSMTLRDNLETDNEYKEWKISHSPIVFANYVIIRFGNDAKKNVDSLKLLRALMSLPTDKNYWPFTQNISNTFWKSAFPLFIRFNGSVEKHFCWKNNPCIFNFRLI